MSRGWLHSCPQPGLLELALATVYFLTTCKPICSAVYMGNTSLVPNVCGKPGYEARKHFDVVFDVFFFNSWCVFLNCKKKQHKTNNKKRKINNPLNCFSISLSLSYLFRDYSKHVGPGINAVWVLLMVVGTGSIYFHATLSFLGQLIDELAIAWVLLAGFAIWTPPEMLNVWPVMGCRYSYREIRTNPHIPQVLA